jgi:hypothetical protein
VSVGSPVGRVGGRADIFEIKVLNRKKIFLLNVFTLPMMIQQMIEDCGVEKQKGTGEPQVLHY